MSALDWLMQQLGSERQDTSTPGDQVVRQDASGNFVPYKPPSGVDALQKLQDTLGVSDLTAAKAAFDRGEYPQALGQGVWGAGQLAGAVAPAVGAVGRFAPAVGRTLPSLLADEAGALKLPGGAPIRAYHGSPHDFDRFDLSKIGTGEGAQAYGHGLYFAEHEPTAVHYRESLAGYQPEITFPDGRKMVSQPWANDPVNHLAGLLPQAEPAWINTSIARAYLQHGEANLADNAANEAWGGLQDRLKPHEREAFNARIEASLPTLQQVTKVQPGKIYEVNLHTDPAKLLDWDKPLSEQPLVSAALSDASQSVLASDKPAGEYVRRAHNNPIFAGDYFGGGRELTPAQLSQHFADRGIPGSKFFDQGSRGTMEGSRNLVVFDPKIIEILRKYGLAGLTAGTGAAALGGSAEAAPADALDRIRRQLGKGAF